MSELLNLVLQAHLRGPALKSIRDLLLVSIDLSNFRLTT
jgi:hypothetical protein